MEFRERAPAKLNLYLHVVGRRDDGYHLLDSLVAFADIADEVTVAPATALSLRIAGPFAAALMSGTGENLVHRAARLYAARLRRQPRVALTLEKRLPVASGIGGGSSDAAATLRALQSLWRAELAEDARADLALALGADVPACLVPRAAFVGGIGERIEPAPPLPPLAVVLANPGVAVATADVYARRAGAFSEPARFVDMPGDAAGLAALLAERRNDLADAARELAPAIADVIAALAATPGALLARMSGSGATCFALYAASHEAEAAAQTLAAASPRWWVKAGNLL
ncbi:MAG TPA: 4-(cytidine 5'-diphospho)-2-C-methyl-D-erythritol kinase [Stellaceae bacterium]|nr:4-(cytidine 5'-diphospho)-2-C-methyl-D-erythritol kinase [Stellaceae bacterium]